MAEQLRARGHDVTAVVERVDLRTTTDEFIFAAAQLEERTIVTEDPDFRVIAVLAVSWGESHHGLILTNPRRLPRSRKDTMGRVVRALDVLLTADVNLFDREYWLS
jgi:predicted nuclease of predicted toxin-antitoxin system